MQRPPYELRFKLRVPFSTWSVKATLNPVDDLQCLWNGTCNFFNNLYKEIKDTYDTEGIVGVIKFIIKPITDPMQDMYFTIKQDIDWSVSCREPDLNEEELYFYHLRLGFYISLTWVYNLYTLYGLCMDIKSFISRR